MQRCLELKVSLSVKSVSENFTVIHCGLWLPTDVEKSALNVSLFSQFYIVTVSNVI